MVRGRLPGSVQEPPTPALMNIQTPDAMPATPQPLRPIDAFIDASSSAGGGAGAELPADTVVGSQAMARWGSCRPVVSPGERVADGLEWEATPPIPSLSHGLAAVQVVQGDLIQQANRSLVTQLDTLASAILLENGAQLEGGGHPCAVYRPTHDHW